MNIDWSKAPEGATHALSTGPKWDGAQSLIGEIQFAVKRGQGYAGTSDPDGVKFCMGKKSWVVVAERPANWTGSGLPPVGTVCEAMTKEFGDHYGWFKCTILHVGKDECAIMLDNSLLRWCDDFRPIRTPERIAAEEREAAILQIYQTITISRAQAEALYDAGYRKQEQPK